VNQRSNKHLTRERANAYRSRCQLVKAAEVAALREASLELKLRQLAALMASAKGFGT